HLPDAPRGLGGGGRTGGDGGRRAQRGGGPLPWPGGDGDRCHADGAVPGGCRELQRLGDRRGRRALGLRQLPVRRCPRTGTPAPLGTYVRWVACLRCLVLLGVAGVSARIRWVALGVAAVSLVVPVAVVAVTANRYGLC